ncbi:MAG TPA: DUF5906 domain-containing protein [Flavobacteriales bacterium]|nr:DUF5906 domain-containing protein [Flavobacteriales bacterium]
MSETEENTPELPVPEKDTTFFNERLLPLGWTPEKNIVHYSWSKADGTVVKEEYPLFEVDANGDITINYYRPSGAKAEYRKPDNKFTTHYQSTRYQVPRVDKKGKSHKYNLPKGAGTFAWFGPELIRAYQEKRHIDTLYMTEGAFKAYCAENNGAYMLALTSITHYMDKNTMTLHPDVIDLLRVLRPKHVVWLVDGDCRNLTRKFPEENPDEDLYTRPNGFFASARNIGTMLGDHAKSLGFRTWFMHVNSDAVEMPPRMEHPKGIDDLLLAYPIARAHAEIKLGPVIRKPDMTDAQFEEKEREQEQALETTRHNWLEEHAAALRHAVIKDMGLFSEPNKFFTRMDLDRPSILRDHFHLRSATDFYSYFQERIENRAFVFEGTKYQWDEGEKALKVLVPSLAKHYIRVGTQYMKRIKVPNKFGALEGQLVPWQKSTIIEDHSKDFCKHVLKLEAFTNVPDHLNWKEIVHGCFNLYAPFEHEAEENTEEPEATYRFLRHIAGAGTVKVPHPKLKISDEKSPDFGKPQMIEVSELDLLLDYIQLIIFHPTQMLPILCLVSKERGTGKTTFAKYLKMLLTANAIFVGNKDFESDFNSHYAGKKLIILDEAMIDKLATVEKIKAMSTADKITVNTKGLAQYEMGFFAAFVILSNNVRSFIKTDDDETRFWVRKINPISDADLDVELETKLFNEIPAFLWRLQNRKMATTKLYRSHFHPPLLDTEALRELRTHSQPMVRKEIVGFLKRIFNATGEETILMHENDIALEIFKGRRVEPDYIKEVLKEHMKVGRYKNDKGEEAVTRYRYHRLVDVPAYENGVLKGRMMEHQPVTCPPGRPFEFKRVDFISDTHWELLKSLPEGGVSSAPGPLGLGAGKNGKPADGEVDDLPF